MRSRRRLVQQLEWWLRRYRKLFAPDKKRLKVPFLRRSKLPSLRSRQSNLSAPELLGANVLAPKKERRSHGETRSRPRKSKRARQKQKQSDEGNPVPRSLQNDVLADRLFLFVWLCLRLLLLHGL